MCVHLHTYAQYTYTIVKYIYYTSNRSWSTRVQFPHSWAVCTVCCSVLQCVAVCCSVLQCDFPILGGYAQYIYTIVADTGCHLKSRMKICQHMYIHIHTHSLYVHTCTYTCTYHLYVHLYTYIYTVADTDSQAQNRLKICNNTCIYK